MALVRLGRNWLKGTELLASLLEVLLANMSSFRTSGFLLGASASESLPRPGQQRATEHYRENNAEGRAVTSN